MFIFMCGVTRWHHFLIIYVYRYIYIYIYIYIHYSLYIHIYIYLFVCNMNYYHPRGFAKSFAKGLTEGCPKTMGPHSPSVGSYCTPATICAAGRGTTRGGMVNLMNEWYAWWMTKDEWWLNDERASIVMNDERCLLKDQQIWNTTYNE